MKYEAYGITDFLNDQFFVEWVKNPDSKSDKFWTKWMASNPEKVPLIIRAQQFISSIEYDDFDPLKKEEYIEMFENVLKNKSLLTSRKSYGDPGMTWLKVAASVSIVLFSLIIYYTHWQGDKDVSPVENLIQYSKVNPLGQKSLITLPDGSKIKLNSGSAIYYNSEFGIRDRFVELKGEAFFDITKNTALPFIIKSGELTTQVIGTAFNVRNYETEANIEVLVVRGEVSVSDDLGSSFVLYPKDILEYNHQDRNVKKSVCKNVKGVIGWKDGILSFDNEPFSNVVDKIQRWYDVKITIEEGFKVKGFYTGDYQNKSLEKVMDGISFASEFKYDILNKNELLIYKKP